MKLLASLVGAALLLVSCGGDGGVTLDGRWDGGSDWGEVIIDGLQGTYSSTFGPDPGEIVLSATGDNTYAGTWAEGTDRFGSIEIEQRSADVVVGTWTADPDSAVPGSSGGQLRWERD